MTPWTVACQTPLSMEFSRQEQWKENRLPFPPPEDLPSPGIESASLVSPALAGGFFTTEPPRKPTLFLAGIFWCHLPLYSFLSHHEMLKHFTHGLTTFWIPSQSPSKQKEVNKQHPAPKLMDIALPWTSECHKGTALRFTSEVYFFVLNGCVLFSCSTIQFQDKISLNLWPSHCWWHLPFLKNESCWPLKVWGLFSRATGLT